MPWPSSWTAKSGRQHLVHFADQFAKMDRLGQHLLDSTVGILRWASDIGISARHGGKAGDEHDLDVGIESEARRASSMPSISGITISVSSISNGSSRSR